MDRRRFLIGSAALPSLASGLVPPSAPVWPGPPPPREDEKYWRELRWHFDIPLDDAYCNTSTLGASPRVVTNAVHDHMRWVEKQLSQSVYRGDFPIYLGGYQDEPALRTRVGRLLGCRMEEIALLRNATMGMSFVAMGLELRKGDQVLMTDQEHPGGRCAYDVRARRDGIEIIEVGLPAPASGPSAVVEAFAAKMSPRTRVLAIPHITSALGSVLPIKAITAMARASNPDVFVVVDGAQSFGHVPVDVKDIGCDAFFSSPHKWLLAPKGTGVLYLDERSHTRVWTTIASSDWDFDREPVDPGRRFSQMGTGNQSLHKGFEAALDFLERIGFDQIHARIKALGDHLREGLQAIDGVTIHSSMHPEMCAGMTNYSIRGWDPHQAALHLYDRYKIMPRAAAPGIRQSLHIYTTMADVDRTLTAVREMIANPDGTASGKR